MQFKRMLLMCSALITIAHSFPTGTQHSTTTSSQNETNVFDVKENKKPMILIMEEKVPKSDSVLVEFVYTSNDGNSIVQSIGTDKNKYVIDYPVNKEIPHQKSNSSEKETEKLVQTLNTDKTTHGQINEPKSDTKVQMMAATFLTPEEISPLSEKWPKYFYDVFNPIQPFPELEDNRKTNQINMGKIVNENGGTYLLNYETEKKEPPYAAGPQLNPLSVYDREFNVPIFD